MDITESEYCLEDTCCMCIDLLDSIEWTLTNAARECWYLVDPDDTSISDDEEIELIVDPVEEDKSQKYNPKERYSPPKYSPARDRHNTLSIHKKKSRSHNQYKHVEEVEHEYNPVSMECHYEALAVSEEGDVFLLDHVMCGALK